MGSLSSNGDLPFGETFLKGWRMATLRVQAKVKEMDQRGAVSRFRILIGRYHVVLANAMSDRLDRGPAYLILTLFDQPVQL